jgi:hypothetical protein
MKCFIGFYNITLHPYKEKPMKRLHQVAIVIVAAALSACATVEQPKLYQTPSGRPEAVFDNTSPSAIIGEIATGCLDHGALIQEQTGTQITCSRELQGDDAFLATLAIGNAYSTPPIQSARFTFVQIGDAVRVQVYQQLQTQFAYGQIRTLELNGPKQFNDAQNLLLRLGGHLPNGTILLNTGLIVGSMVGNYTVR